MNNNFSILALMTLIYNDTFIYVLIILELSSEYITMHYDPLKISFNSFICTLLAGNI